jgi:dTMP kinase
MYRPKFIAIEGPDGAGKSTLVDRLGLWLNDDIKQPTTVARSPGGTPFANAVRSIVFSGITSSKQAQAMGMLTAEVDCFDNVILPSLLSNRHVIGDRWLMSGRIYQSFMANRPPDNIEKLIQAALPHPAARPDVYIVLNAAPEILLSRVVASVEASKAEQKKAAPAAPKGKKKVASKTVEEAAPMAQEGDAERQALAGKLDYYQGLSAAYARAMVFSDGVPCVYMDTSEKTPDEVYDRIREIVMQGVLST